jgi:FixJ family two-component response regulator
VLFLDDDEDLRETLAEFVSSAFNRELLAVGSVAAMVELGERALECDCAILDINLGPDRPSGIEAFAWLARQGFRGRIAFLTGHGRSHPLVDRALRLGEACVLQKPITVAELEKLIERDVHEPC